MPRLFLFVFVLVWEETCERGALRQSRIWQGLTGMIFPAGKGGGGDGAVPRVCL